MRWTEIMNEAHGLPRGPISGHPIRNTGDLGKLEDALDLWVEGETERAEPHLLGMRALMQPFNPALGCDLYRGIVIDDGKEVQKALRDGITITHQRKALESWSTSPEAVDEFMAGWDRPWIMITCPSSELEVLIDLETFDEQARPFTRMHSQHEVIVLAKPSVHFTADQISVPFSMNELRDYEHSMGRDIDDLDESAGYLHYPPRLDDEREIAAYIADLASDDVDEEFIEEHFRGCSATLQYIPMAEISEGNPDGNVRSKAKEKRYAKMDPATIPPLVIEDGVVMDGNHRLRVAKAAGAQGMWCYVVSED